MKSIIQRIQFYTRKAAQNGVRKRKVRRFDRLMAYRARLRQLIEVEGEVTL